jgi:hypothetical protein
MLNGFPEFDEWDAVPQPDWRAPLDLSSQPPIARGVAPLPGGPAFPEVEIGSSSDEDAPPAPESTQLARENLQLRAQVNALVTQSKSLEQANDSLKHQLSKHRHSFALQMKSRIKELFK